MGHLRFYENVQMGLYVSWDSVKLSWEGVICNFEGVGGLGKVSDGVRKVSAGLVKVLDGLRKKPYGVRKVSDGLKKVSYGVGKVLFCLRRCQIFLGKTYCETNFLFFLIYGTNETWQRQTWKKTIFCEL